MLLSTVRAIWEKNGFRITESHSQHDFVKDSFEIGEKTAQGIEIRARLRDSVKKKGKRYTLYGHLRPQIPVLNITKGRDGEKWHESAQLAPPRAESSTDIAASAENSDMPAGFPVGVFSPSDGAVKV